MFAYVCREKALAVAVGESGACPGLWFSTHCLSEFERGLHSCYNKCVHGFDIQ